MYRNLYHLYPKGIRHKYKKALIYSDLKVHAEKFIGFIIFASVCLSLTLSFIFARLTSIPLWIFFICFFVAIQIISYFLLVLRVDAKGKFVEDILPDALQLMSSNLRAGLTTDKALILSARPEFGPFAEELNIVGKEITMGKDIEEALAGMTKRIRSEKLEKTMALIVAGLRSGGELVALLSQTAQNLRNQKFVDEKIKSNVLMYVIFIFSAIGFGAPLLFALSTFLVETLTKSLGMVDIPAETAAQFPVTLSKISITSSFVLWYVLISLAVTSIMGSLVIGLIRRGREREGLKYVPILMLLSIGVFFLIKLIISTMFGATFF